jgi:hypothetical protein
MGVNGLSAREKRAMAGERPSPENINNAMVKSGMKYRHW